MSSYIFSCSPAYPSISCCLSPVSVKAPPVSLAFSPSLPDSLISSSSSTALQCPHFQSYVHTIFLSNFQFLMMMMILSVWEELNFGRCSGCSHEANLDRPSVVDEAADFFKSFGVSDFTFDSGKLVST